MHTRSSVTRRPPEVPLRAGQDPRWPGRAIVVRGGRAQISALSGAVRHRLRRFRSTGPHRAWTDWAEPINASAIVCTMPPVLIDPAARHPALSLVRCRRRHHRPRALHDTPAGQKALITALRARVAHQQQVVAAYRARDARMAALLRSMVYRARTSGGLVAESLSAAVAFGAAESGRIGGGGSPLAGVAALPPLAGTHRDGSSAHRAGRTRRSPRRGGARWCGRCRRHRGAAASRAHRMCGVRRDPTGSTARV